MTEEKICPHCGKTFKDSKHKDKIFCSRGCYINSKTKAEIGKTYGRLKILDIETFKDKYNTRTYAICECECGKIIKTRLSNLKDGTTQSCGCYHSEILKKGCKPLKHGMTNDRLYNVWQGMKQRCYYSKHNHYKDYGGRGIIICDEWKNNFNAFYNWAISHGYDKNAKRNQCTIDRIDVNGNYEPSNCRWVSQSIQNLNKRELGAA